MKKYLRFFIIPFILVFCSILIACTSSPNGQNEESVCQNHIDLNEDSLCDNCEEALDPICINHTDTNHDGICDSENCEHTLTVIHSDADGDGICDGSQCAKALEGKEESNEPQEEPKEEPEEEEPKQEPENPKEEPDDTTEVPETPSEPCEICVDLDENLICDVCKKEIVKAPQGVTLVKDGEVKFSILLEYDGLSTDEIAKVNEFADYLESIDISPPICNGAVISDTDAKIIINSISFLGEEYEVDPHYLGPKGYAVKADGEKILLRAGSGEALGNAIDYLKEKAFSLTPLSDSVFLYSDSVELPQSDYKFSSVLIGKSDVSDYKITYEKADEESLALAKAIQSILYESSGVWLNLISSSESNGECCISVKTQSRSGGVGFYVKIRENGNLEIISEFKNKTLVAGKEYINLVFGNTTDTTEFVETQINVRDIFYSDFGAVGDGITDDFDAIKKTHDYANEHGHTVVSDKNAKYYIGITSGSVAIRTDTLWNGATFIIDDRDIEGGKEATLSIFTVESDYEQIILGSKNEKINAINESGGLTQSTEKIDLAVGYAAILIIENDSQKESVLVDKDGYLLQNHSLRSDFNSVKSITVIRADDSAVTIEGGIFTVYSNQHRQSEPFARNISVRRSNTVIRSIEYEIDFVPKKEKFASPYLAFIEVFGANNVLICDSVFSARISYAENEESPIISSRFSHSVTIQNCDQSNFFDIDGFPTSNKFARAICIYSSKRVLIDSSIVIELFFDEATYDTTVKNSVIHKIGSENGQLKTENNSFE